ncbi:DUF7530 family protein [Halococcoides cellulosivorans]|uniref:Uncharacterized protein n=1 Tax=Halococcoides cellulosivorans TaxID=1679096 RepID=A0A2R4X0F5_9EURY|nr:hypothetical protein [Halococcoides cellulosivorans]AWB27278.1 hypothetical protein HARCEL1_05960 [Halococcoides cellulosivorans]
MAETDDWAYLNIVGALPGWTPTPMLALAIQFGGFGGVALVVAAVLDQWTALPAALVAIGVATAGSGLMTVVSDRIRRADPPPGYRDLLFGSSVDVVMGVVAFVAFLTYVLTRDPPGIVGAVVGPETPAPVVFLALLVIWDLCYRIGTAWWASVVGAWRSLVYAGSFDRATRQAFVVCDLLVLAFAGIQLALVPFAWGTLLAWLVVGHVLAVAVVSGGSIVRLRLG